MVDDVKPTQECMNQRPQDTVVDIPAEESGEHGANAPEDPTPAATAPLRIFFNHGSPPEISFAEQNSVSQ
jgi:hypothetical protein